MATSITLNGVAYSIPAKGDSGWGPSVTLYLVAISQGVLTKAGGSFTLTADADFGAIYGLRSSYFRSRGTAASAGVFRLANAELLAWRNQANNANITLGINASDEWVFNGTALSTAELGYLAGVSSALQTQLDAKAPIAGAITANRALRSDASGNVEASAVTSTELGYLASVSSPIQTQLNSRVEKDSTLTTGAARIPIGTTAQRPVSAANGYLRANSDTNQFEGYVGGVWGAIGGGGGGGINYFESTQSHNAETGVGSWTTYVNAAQATPVDGNPLGGATITFTRTTSSPLRGTGSFLLTKDAADRQGEGASCDFTIDSADTESDMQILFDFDSSHADYVAGDIGVYIYDFTNATLITPSATDLSKGSNGKAFITWRSTDSTSYRLILHQATTNAAAVTVKFDNFEVGPLKVVQGQVTAEKIRVRYTTNAGQNIPNSTPTIVDFGTKTYDDGHTSDTVTTGAAWKFTAPRTGIYNINVHVVFQLIGGWDDGEDIAIDIFKNGTRYSGIDYKELGAGATAIFQNIAGSADVELAAGDYIDIRATQVRGGGTTLQPDAEYNWVAIHEVTDYQETRFGVNSDVEYVSHDGTNIVYGENGAVIPTTTPASSADTYIISSGFSRTFKHYIIETQRAGDGPWMQNAVDVVSADEDVSGSPWVGVTVYYDGTDIRMLRGKYRRGGSTVWSSVPAGTRWRVVGSDNPLGIGVPTATADRAGTISSEYASEEQDLGTLTWTGTAPSGTVSKKYWWVQVGKRVDFWFRIEASVAGVSNTQVSFSVPSDVPTIKKFSSVAATSEWVGVSGNGMIVAAPSSSQTTGALSVYINGSGNLEVYLGGTSVAARYAEGHFSYRTDD